MTCFEWINKLKNDEVGNNLECGVFETYILVDDNKVIGMMNIRYNPNDEIISRYGVRPSERRKVIALIC